MVQRKAHEVDAWLARPDPRMRLVLIYGPDRGLVSERAQNFAARTGLPLDDPFSMVKLDAADADLAQSLLSEARTVAMFAKERLIWVRGAGIQKDLADCVKQLVAEPPTDAIVLIEGGDLKKGTALRATVEGGPQSVALPCYSDDARGVDSLIDEELGKAGLAITLEARQMLKLLLGGDRLASRGELQKLALFSRGRQVGVEEVRESVGDVTAMSADDAVDAVLAGNAAELDQAFMRMAAAGAAPAALLGAALRQFQTLQLLRRSMDEKNSSASAAVATARPPVFFSRRKVVELALQRWSSNGIARALDRLQAAILETRRRPELLSPLARQALLALALESARHGRGR